MRLLSLTLTLTLAALLGGCAAGVTRVAPGNPNTAIKVPAESAQRAVVHLSGSATATKSADWEAFRGEWRDAMTTEAATAGITLVWRDGEARADGEAGTVVAIDVQDYRYVSTGARFGLGIMTGNAFVDARVRYLDARSGAVFGEDKVNTSSSAWQGVFSAMTSKQLAAIAKEIITDIRGK
jgi:hypothetical protein